MSKHYDITFLYEIGDQDKVDELAQYCKVIKFKGNMKPIDTDVCIYSSAWGTRPEKYINASKYIQVCHADYEQAIKDWDFKYIKLPKVTEHVSVGQNVADALKRMYGYDSTVIYNLLDNEIKTEKVLRLIAASRISREKGFERIIKMAKLLKDSKKPFVWFIYGDITQTQYQKNIVEQLRHIPEVIFLGAKIGIESFVADADYLVQLSDSEGFCYSIYEALQVGTAVIATDFASAKEQVTDGMNGYIVDMELSNLDIDKLWTIPNEITFVEKSSEKDWCKMVEKKTKKIKDKETTVVIIKQYDDVELSRRVNVGETLPVLQSRADALRLAKVAE